VKPFELRADAAVQHRLEELAARNTEGDLTRTERVEYETYVRAIQVINILPAQPLKPIYSSKCLRHPYGDVSGGEPEIAAVIAA